MGLQTRRKRVNGGERQTSRFTSRFREGIVGGIVCVRITLVLRATGATAYGRNIVVTISRGYRSLFS